MQIILSISANTCIYVDVYLFIFVHLWLCWVFVAAHPPPPHNCLDSDGFTRCPLNSRKGPHAGLFSLRRLHWRCAHCHRACEAGSPENRASGVSPTKQMFGGKIDIIKTMEDKITPAP